jgi:hypothetical protein
LKITKGEHGFENTPACGAQVVVNNYGIVTALAQSWCISGQPTPKIRLMKEGDTWEEV